MTPKIKNLHADYLGMFLWFLFLWWNPLTRIFAVRWAKKTLIRTRKKGASKIAYFVMANEHYSKIIPWKTFKNEQTGKLTVDLASWNPKFWKGYKLWLTLIKLTGTDPETKSYDSNQILEPFPCPFMNRYNDWIFKRNINNIHGFFDPNAFPYQSRFVRKLLLLHKEVFGLDKPTIRFLNEPSRDGTDATGHLVADWHRDMYIAVRDLVDLENVYADEHSEFSRAWFCPRHKCPKCDSYFDGAEYGLLDDKGFPRIKTEQHGFSIIQNLTDGNFDAWKRARLFRVGKFSEDGCAGDFMAETKGYALKDDNGKVIWAIGDEKQTQEMVEYGVGEALKVKKTFIFGLFPLETLRKKKWSDYFIGHPETWKAIKDKPVYSKTKLIEDYRPKTINWKRWNHAVRGVGNALKN